MHKLFCNKENIKEDQIIVSDQNEIHHIKNVLWLKIGDSIEVSDQLNAEYLAKIEKINKDAMVLKIISTKQITRSDFKLTVACAIAKNAKFDDIVDKLTQIGVDEIIPLATERVIVKFDKESIQPKFSRWVKIAASASSQSHRSRLPVLSLPQSFGQFVKSVEGYELKLIPTLMEGNISLAKALNNCSAKRVVIAIGPEGDFSPEEIGLAQKSGFIPVSLGENILRVDTAAIAVSAFIKLHENN